MRQFLIAALVCLTGLAARPAGAAESHPFDVHDLLAMQRITELRPSPRGDRVAFVLRTTDLPGNRGIFDLWLVDVDGSGLRQLTADAAVDGNPVWSPDGASLYFLTTRSGSSQVWRLPIGTAGATTTPTALQVTDLPLDVSNLRLADDGSRLLFSLEVFVDCPTLACTRERVDAVEKGKARGHLYEGGFIRHWDAWSDGRRNHLFTATLGAGGMAGEPVDLTRGMDADVPSRPFGGTEEFTFSPDGRSVVFSARVAGREEPWSTNFDLYQAAADGSGKPANLTAANPAWDTYPAFSPDGKTLAYAAMARPGFESDRFQIVLRSLPDGKERKLAADWDRSTGEMFFSRDGKTLYTAAEDLGQTALFAIDVASGRVRRLVTDGQVRSPGLAGDLLVFGREDLRSPVDLYTVGEDGANLRQITRVNQDRLAAVRMGDYEQFTFAGAGGDTVYGYVVKPVDFEPGRKYPLAFLIHGGPEGIFGNEFHYRWNRQIYAGAGYAVVTIDFHGSTSYGQAFTDAIRGDWGGKPLVDLQQGLAAVLARYPWIDGDRACALGASYGGYMTNWIAGQWPDRFRCLVTHDGMLDQRMMYYGTEELWFPEWEQGGPYWQNPEGHEKWNPVQFVDRWKTPMLVIHGGLDYRVPDNQGIATFNVLQRRGIPSQFLYLSNEGHWVLKPADSLLWHQTVLAWLDRWLHEAPARTSR
jgi:dipeptidyl aminopeptidase/acylaminoacyl peptidase